MHAETTGKGGERAERSLIKTESEQKRLTLPSLFTFALSGDLTNEAHHAPPGPSKTALLQQLVPMGVQELQKAKLLSVEEIRN